MRSKKDKMKRDDYGEGKKVKMAEGEEVVDGRMKETGRKRELGGSVTGDRQEARGRNK